MSRIANCAVIMVTFNSERYLHQALRALFVQSVSPRQIILVDTGSDDTGYLDAYAACPGVTVLKPGGGIGFCRGNNEGYDHVLPDIDYVLLLNPDAFLEPTFIEQAVAYMELPRYCDCGALTGAALGYDVEKGQPNEKYDSTGIFHTWYGRWYDRGQGQAVSDTVYSRIEKVPAIVGALFFLRKSALDEALHDSFYIFDPRFFMYKEDIDLSLRLRRRGWSLYYFPDLIAHHCRGWSNDRKKMPRRARLASALNELRIHCRRKMAIPTLYSAAKYLGVRLFDV